MESSFRDQRRATEAGGTAGGGPRLLPRDVQEKRFHLAFRGYNEREVDEFLDLVTEELARLHAENRRLRDELRALRAGAPARGGTGSQAEATLDRAREEAARIVAEAQARARQVLAEAQTRASGPLRPGLPPEMAVFLAREKEFLRALAGLLQSHAEGLKQEVRRLRQAATSPAPARGTPTAPPPATAPPTAAPPPATAPPTAAPTAEPARPGQPTPAPSTEPAPPPPARPAEPPTGPRATVPDAGPPAPGPAGGSPEEGPGAEEGEDEREDEEDERSLRELFWGEA